MRRSRLLTVVPATAVASALAVSSPALSSAAPAGPAAAPTPHVLARHLLSPLTLALDGRTVYVTQNFAGKLTRVRPGHRGTTWYASKHGNEVGGVSVLRHRVAFTETEGSEQGNTDSWLKMGDRRGRVHTVADIHRFEARRNPDGRITYGARGISADCAAQWPTDQAGPPTYPGGIDSHPYATFQTRRQTYVADAGMNAILAVKRSGHIRTVAVTPPVPVEITSDLASQFGVPDCAVGLTYYGESVPTDVERGASGALYVTTEGGFLGEQMPLGSIYRVNPRSGHLSRVATGLATPTGLAVGRHGNLFVAQLFGGEISRVDRAGHVRPYAKVPLPAAVEMSHHRLYATINTLPPSDTAPPRGKVVRFGR